MPSLSERLTEVMTACRWTHADLVRITRQSSSVVSQWLGNGSKEIKSIGRLEAALAIERESGFSALWVATGGGPKMRDPLSVWERQGVYWSAEVVLERLGPILQAVPLERRNAVAETLAGYAREGGADHWRLMLLTLLRQPSVGS